MGKYFYFGEKAKGYPVRVLNEREVRAGAGILFFFAMIAFMNAWLTGNFYYTKIFVVAFLIDFFIRIFVNPKYSPSLVAGKYIVGNQEVEYVGAPQKRFAWGIGMVLAVTMFFLVVVNNVIGPINLLICLTCLLLLFFEAAFGICIGCKIYNLFTGEPAQLCPGGVCKAIKKENIQKINFFQILIVLLFVAIVASIPFFGIFSNGARSQNSAAFGSTDAIALAQNAGNSTDNSSDCTPPDWAIAMGHAQLWKLHHGCA